MAPLRRLLAAAAAAAVVAVATGALPSTPSRHYEDAATTAAASCPSAGGIHAESAGMELHSWYERYDHSRPKIDKWHHYLRMYARHFEHLRGTPAVWLEIGVGEGGSLHLWRDYLGPDAKIYAIDINPAVKRLEKEVDATIFIGDQDDAAFLKRVAAHIRRESGKVDVVLDDGGHTMTQQLTSIDVLFPLVQTTNGLYVIEDMHTSYYEQFGGGWLAPTSFVEHVKSMVDQLNAWHCASADGSADLPGCDNLQPTFFTKTVVGLHFYDSVMFIELGQHPAPNTIARGTSLNGERTVEEQIYLALPCAANVTAKVPVAVNGAATVLKVPLELGRIDSTHKFRNDLSVAGAGSIRALCSDGMRLRPPPGYRVRARPPAWIDGTDESHVTAMNDVIDYLVSEVAKPACGVRERLWRD